MENVPFHSPRIPVVNNVDVALETEPQAIKAALARQACNPVRWTEIIRAMSGRDIATIVECGPGKVLMGLTKRIQPGLESYAVTDPASLAQTREALA